MLEDIKTSAEVAVMLKMSQEYIASLCRKGIFFGAIKKGKTWLIPHEAVKVYTLQYGNKRQRKNADSSSLARP
ncbi:MAG: helix-turn-helix domain-containing protein [Synergistaceae bacterium]|nr:helix-turn-helix domain-containing protein [Synergistaceae bacterium]